MAPLVGYHEEGPNFLGKLIWDRDIGNGGHNLLVGRKEVHGNGMPYTRTMVWEVHERVKVEDGGYKNTRLRRNLGRGKSAFGRMVRKVGSSVPSKETKDIVCGGGSGNWIMWRPKGRGSFPLITEGVIKFWEDTRLRNGQPHVMVTL